MTGWNRNTYPQETVAHDRLRVIMQEAWVSMELPHMLKAFIPARCKAGILAGILVNGLYTYKILGISLK